MIKFVKKILLFGLIFSCIIIGLLYYFYRIGGNDLPAPAFSNSISFNEKIDFIRGKDLSKIEHIVLGSSMSLNNIDSETIVKYLGENYFNLGSWGFKISDSENYLRNMIHLFPNLKTVIISTTFVDFSSSVRNIVVDYDLVRNSILYDIGNWVYLFSLDIRYLKNNSETNKLKMRSSGSYDILSFDKYGGVILKLDKDQINQERWNNDILDFDVSESELKSLSGIINLLHKRNVKTVIAIPPQREGLMNEEKRIRLGKEIDRIRSAVHDQNGFFVNSFERGSWNDSLFVDYCHLNKAGAVIYTDYILSSIAFQP